MEQITLTRGETQKKVETPTSKAKFEIPKVEETIARIEEAEEVEEEQELESFVGVFGAFFSYLAARRAKRADAAEEERLAKEMEKIHPKEKKRSGCGCGM